MQPTRNMRLRIGIRIVFNKEGTVVQNEEFLLHLFHARNLTITSRL